MRSLVVWVTLVTLAGALDAQEPAPPAPPTAPAQPAESLKQDSAPLALQPPSPEQQRYLNGLRSVGRGVAQLKTGVDRLSRAQASRDTTRQRQAGQMLGGFCGSARSFLASGRAQMQPTVYEDSIRLKARRLTTQVDTLIKFMPSCEAQARKAPAPTAADLLARLRNYDAALRDFRLAIGLPVRDTIKTPMRQ